MPSGSLAESCLVCDMPGAASGPNDIMKSVNTFTSDRIITFRAAGFPMVAINDCDL